MIAKTSTFVALAVLVAAALCGSASAAHGRHLTTCPYHEVVNCDVHCEATCTYPCPCAGYVCCHGECKKECPQEPPPAACEGLFTKPNGVRLEKVCVASGPGSETSTNCGVGCYDNCFEACAGYGGLKPEYSEDVPRSFCNNFPGGNCKDVGLNGPCCGCDVDAACASPPPL